MLNIKEKFSRGALLVTGLVGLIVGFSLSYLFRPNSGMSGNRGMDGAYRTSSGDSSDARSKMMAGNLDKHFIEQMIPHHQDAVSMSELAVTKAEHPELRQLAENIKRDQSKEIGQMRDWYSDWYGTAVPEFSTGAMDHGMGHGTMAGAMGDGTDLETLRASAQFDKEFIEQMIPHHQMAIMMAQMLLGGTDREELQKLGANIIASQNAEIAQMRAWYKLWYR